MNLLPGAFRKAGDVATLIEGAVPGWRRDRALEPRRRRDAEKAVAGLKVGFLGPMLKLMPTRTRLMDLGAAASAQRHQHREAGRGG